ncbi:MAG: hypothetical protein JST73_12060 [Actinobacteria bacterium]|nr:hypothetical protein [Actinomycetota bacterium]
MFKRVVWFTAGVAAGVTGLRRLEREVADRRARLEPDALVNTATEAAGRGAERVRSAIDDGRREMHRVSRQLEEAHDPARRPPRSGSRRSAVGSSWPRAAG